MKALVIGGDSKLGHALHVRLHERGHKVVVTTRRRHESDHLAPGCVYLDMLDPRLPEFPDDVGLETWTVFIMAAITGVVPGERHPDAWRVNAEAPVALALQAYQRGWRVVFMSSGTVEMAQHTASAHQKTYVEGVVHMIGGLVVRPLPTVPPEKYDEVADLMIDSAEPWRTGVVRWEG
jgi:nucleoside-diphosphate-sugar epimerase